MTPQSVGVAYVATILVGVMAGWLLHRFVAHGKPDSTWPVAITFTVAAVAGLVLFQASKLVDAARVLAPATAVDWLPIITIAALPLVWVKPNGARWFIAIMMAIAIPIRLLWGSIYFRDLSNEPWTQSTGLLVAIAAWVIGLAIALAASPATPRRRFDANALAWGISIAATALVIAMSGSFLYGAAVGVIGLGVVVTLMVLGRLPTIASVPIVVLIGLSAAYSELPIGIAVGLLIAWIGLTRTTRDSGMPTSDVDALAAKLTPWSLTLIRTTSVVVAIVALVITAARFRDAIKRTPSGYDEVVHKDTKPKPTIKSESSAPKIKPSGLPDPFGPAGGP